jgi:hypothetical protein
MVLCILLGGPKSPVRDRSGYEKTSMANDPSIQGREETGKSSTDASSSSKLSPVATPASVWPGMTLNWGSPFHEILLHAELPFWLLVADCSLRVSGDMRIGILIPTQRSSKRPKENLRTEPPLSSAA